VVRLALYRKPGKWGNALIRWRTSSPYSHCELVVQGVCLTAANWANGVRAEVLDLSEGWDIIELPWADESAVINFFHSTAGKRYDYLGLLGRIFDIPLQGKDKWFCSEWCAAALGMAEPWRFTPADLAAACAPWAKTPQEGQKPYTAPLQETLHSTP
jgi:hypothetical protein